MPFANGRLVGACAAAAFAAVACRAQNTPARPFVVAVQTRPNRLLPVARFTGSDWINTWPDPEDAKVPAPTLDRIPIAWLSKPVTRTWTLWPSDGVKHDVDIVGTDRDAGGCSEPVTLRFDDVWNVKASSAHMGLAVDTDQSIEGFRRIAASDPEWHLLESVVTQTYLANQSRLVAAASPWLHDALSGINVGDLPLTIESLYRPAVNSASPTYYFVASKTTKDRHGTKIGLAASGWLQRDAVGAWSAVGVRGDAVGSDGGEAGVTPLGAFLLSGRTYWIVAASGYESIGFVVYEITAGAARQALVASGGGC